MKNLISKWLVLFLFISQMTTVPHARAVTAGFMGKNLVLALVGVAALGGSVATALPAGSIVNSEKYDRMKRKKKIIGWTLVALSTILMFSGFILLSEENKTIDFVELDDLQAAELGIASEQMAVFNSEVEEANAVKNQIAQELNAIKNPTAEDSVKIWEQLRSSLAVETQEVMAKIASRLIEKR